MQTMVYLKWTRGELVTLEMDALYTEIDDDGWVHREVGISANGQVIHPLTPTTGFGIIAAADCRHTTPSYEYNTRRSARSSAG